MKIAFVIAHYHPDGKLGPGMASVLWELSARDILTILVSTNLRSEELALMPPGTQVILRDNLGYDFYSYRIGLAHLPSLTDFDYVCCLNNSIIVTDAGKLIGGFLAHLDGTKDAIGLTMSHEVEPHLQSYLMGFSQELLAANAFKNWWQTMSPVSSRDMVILHYEWGLSEFLLQAGFTLGSAYSPSDRARLRALAHAIDIGHIAPEISPQGTVTLALSDADKLNPTHFMWEELLDQFGIVKRELIKKNPFHHDVSSFLSTYADLLSQET